ncbi:ABC transporter ATP-binding protein [Nafulsella turpanensis]|uniref:ABC transporter ATP-binding protein n=1 Tax=Nafulsella turpanensis TaxID=1265690 RepID=UPI00034BCFB2|nr:ATP-binding cassette domain-containing protein [Nafulsella turpanensis]
MMPNSAVIRISGLHYHYSREENILSDINLQVEQGNLYGFLGPNGSGKTTTLSLLLGLLKKQKGSIEIFGQEFQANRLNILKRTGSLIESPSLYRQLTARENLEVYRSVYGAKKERVGEVLKLVGLEDTGTKKAGNFSLGMKQRLAIALALLHRPELLILDEPTNGLDPGGIVELRELIKRLNKDEGITMLISSHLLSEVERMVSHLGIIFKGRMLFQGSLEELRLFQQKQSRLKIHSSDNEAAMDILKDYHPEKTMEGLLIPFRDYQEVALINSLLTKNRLGVYLLQPQERSLEQLFMDLTSTHS